jgi:hypothetical protein
VNLELVKATANCRLSGPSGSQLRRRPVPQIGQHRGFEATFNPVAQVQIEEVAFPEFSQSLLLTTAFEDESLIRKAFEKRLNVDRDFERKVKARRHILKI